MPFHVISQPCTAALCPLPQPLYTDLEFSGTASQAEGSRPQAYHTRCTSTGGGASGANSPLQTCSSSVRCSPLLTLTACCFLFFFCPPPPPHPTPFLWKTQILSILEELHEQKAHALKHRHHKRSTSTGGGAPGANSLLQSVPEGGDDTIAAVRAAAAAAAENGYGQHYGSNGSNGGGYGSDAAVAAMAAARLVHGSNGSYGSAVAAVSGGLEQLLWSDPWDTAALTQLLELLLQVRLGLTVWG